MSGRTETKPRGSGFVGGQRIGGSLPKFGMPSDELQHVKSGAQQSRLSSLSSHLAFAGCITATAFIRWRLDREAAYPTGLDGGNWLAFGHAIFGEHIRASSLVYPPLIPVITVASERLFGTYGGVQAVAYGAGAAPALGAYVLLYNWGLQWRAAVLAGFLAASAGTGEAMAWGGYPQLVGLGILPLFILALDKFLTSQSLQTAIAPALLLLLALATSDFVGLFTLLVGFIYLVTRFWLLARTRKGNSVRNVLLGFGATVALALPMAPTYYALAAGTATNELVKLGARTSGTALDAFNGVIKDFSAFWLAAFVVAFLAPVLLLMGRDRLPLLSGAILVPSAALLAIGGENRIAYLVPLGIVVGLGAWLELLWKLPDWARPSLHAALVICLAIDVLFGTLYYASQLEYYKVLDPNVVQGLARLSAVSGPNQVIAVSPAPNDWELGWWVEGAAHRRSIYAGNPIWLSFSDEKTRNAIANNIFAPQNDVDQSRAEARLAGATYLFVAKDWSGYQSWVTNGGGIDPTAIVYQNDGVLIIETGA